jgi:lysophospholipase L1-like esterase
MAAHAVCKAPRAGYIGRMLKRWGLLLALVMAAAIASATPIRILAVGDSMTEEYAFEVPFSAPASDPGNANMHNWPELLRFWRPAEATMGSYASSIPAYTDLRDAGSEWNFGIPGATTSMWNDILLQSSLPIYPLPTATQTAYYLTRNALISEIPSAEVVVIFLGGNDVKSSYGDLYSGNESASFYTDLITRLAFIHDFIRARTAVPIVICTAPNVGATYAVSVNYNDPVHVALARSKIDSLNQSIANLAAGKGATLVPIHTLTDRIFDDHPFQINGTEFQITPNDQNTPDRIFCRDGFHPATMAQALIANLILDGITRATGRPLTQFGNREILQTVLGLNPDQPYLNWAAGYPGIGSMTADADGDGIPNLAEYVLGTSPRVAGSPFTFPSGGHGTLQFVPSVAALRFASLTVLESSNLSTWSTVPSGRINKDPGGTWTVAPNGQPRNFYRLRAETRQ